MSMDKCKHVIDKITLLNKWEDRNVVQIKAISNINGETITFYIETLNGKYREDLGCVIFTNCIKTCQSEHREDLESLRFTNESYEFSEHLYSNFCKASLIEAAENYIKEFAHTKSSLIQTEENYINRQNKMNDIDKSKHTYLGDGVYAEWDGYGCLLRANDHRDHICTDKIYIEPDVLESLIRFYKNMIKNTSRR